MKKVLTLVSALSMVAGSAFAHDYSWSVGQNPSIKDGAVENTKGMLTYDGKKFTFTADEEDVVKKKVMSMFTDPNHLRVEDPGQVEGNPVFIYLDAFCKDEYFEEFWPEYKNLDELKAHYQRGGLGDVKVKKFLNKVLQAELAPIRARRKEWEQKLPEVFEILKEGSRVAEAKAAETLKDVKAAMRINYFDDEDFLN